jgi:hypothetical protein
MLLFAPDEPELWREAGAMHAECGNLRSALIALERFMILTRDGAARHQAAAAIQMLRSRLH